MSDEAKQIGKSRLHVPGRPDPNLPLEPPFVTIKDQAGNAVQVPVVFVGAIDNTAAQQIYAVSKAAVNDGLKDFARGVAALVVQALTPPPPIAPEAEKPPAEAEGEKPAADNPPPNAIDKAAKIDVPRETPRAKK